MDLKEEAAIGGNPEQHWYYIAKERAIQTLLGDQPMGAILDVGAGSGVFSRMLIREGMAEQALCVDPNYTDAWIADRSTSRVDFRREIEDASVDAVLMIDVIEHVDDDAGLIAEYVDKVAPGTRFLISVPAFNFLWSSHDDFLEHRRRYRLESLEAVAREGGLEPLETRYFFGALFPAVAALRLMDRALKGDEEVQASALKAAPGWLNKTMVAVHDIERALLFPFNKVAGVTAFCLACKPDDADSRRSAA